MKILWLKNNLLHPLDSGGKIRTYNLLHRIKDKHEIHYAAFTDEKGDEEYISKAEEYCHRLFYASPPDIPRKNTIGYYLKVLMGYFNKYPFTVSAYRSDEFRVLVTKLAGENNYDLLIADFLTMCMNIPDELSIPKVHFSHNVEAMIWKRHVENEANPVKKIVFSRERNRVEKFEREIIRSYPLTIAVSKNDRDYFSEVYGADNVSFITTGVDTEYFKPDSTKELQNRILFLGSMDWMPNIDAAKYFAEIIFPLIKKEIVDAEFYIVGRNPSDSIKKLGEEDRNIIVTGTVPDVRPFVQSATCAVVPIRIGGGTRLKIYEMMSMAKAVVSTTIGAEGLLYNAGENIIIEDNPENYSNAVVRLLKDEPHRSSVGEKARELVLANCSWSSVTDKFVNLISGLCER